MKLDNLMFYFMKLIFLSHDPGFQMSVILNSATKSLASNFN